MSSSNFIPREERPYVWARRARDKAHADGKTAMEAALAAINAGFHKHWLHERQLTVQRAMKRGAADVRNRCEYSWVAYLCPNSVNGAFNEINRQYFAEVADRKMRYGNGFSTKSPNKERTLEHARLFIRWFRRYGDYREFPRIIDALTTNPNYAVEIHAQAAE